MHAQTLPIATPALSAAAFTFAGSMCDGSSIGISTESKPQSLNFLKSRVLSVVKGEVKRKVLMPKRIVVRRKRVVEVTRPREGARRTQLVRRKVRRSQARVGFRSPSTCERPR